MENKELQKNASVNHYQQARRIYFMSKLMEKQTISVEARAALYVIHRMYQQYYFKSKRNEKGEILIWMIA